MRRRFTGRFTGRGTGIIDTLHLVEVARAAGQMDLAVCELEPAVQKWFAEYLEWMATSKNGMQERDAKNNHGTCWVAQVAAFAQFTGNARLTDVLPRAVQDGADAESGSAGRQLPAGDWRGPSRTAIRLFNLDAMAILCADPGHAGGQFVEVATAGRPRDGESGGVTCTRSSLDKKKWPKSAGRDVFRPVAGASAEPAFRGAGVGEAGVSGVVAEAGWRTRRWKRCCATGRCGSRCCGCEAILNAASLQQAHTPGLKNWSDDHFGTMRSLWAG